MSRFKPPLLALPLLGLLALLASMPGGWVHRGPWLAAWLSVWSFGMDLVLGALVMVWIHVLTSGDWGEAIRRPALESARLLPWLALLFLPVLAQLPALYPWASTEPSMLDQIAAPAFKQAWLRTSFFQGRAVILLLLWCLLAWGTLRPRWENSRVFAALALIAYGFSSSVAAADWTMSLQPLWYSSIYGLLAATGQLATGLAWAVLVTCLHADSRFSPRQGRDLGNLLLVAVIGWAYLAFSQFLIIWSENLPHEIAWYVHRRGAPWQVLGVGAALLGFAVAGVLLLFRAVKESRQGLAAVAIILLVARLLDRWYTVLPTVSPEEQSSLIWLAPLEGFGLLALLGGPLWRISTRETARA